MKGDTKPDAVIGGLFCAALIPFFIDGTAVLYRTGGLYLCLLPATVLAVAACASVVSTALAVVFDRPFLPFFVALNCVAAAAVVYGIIADKTYALWLVAG